MTTGWKLGSCIPAALGLALFGGLVAPAAHAEDTVAVDDTTIEEQPAFKSPLKDRPLFSPTRSAPIIPEIVEQQPDETPPPVAEETPPPPWRLVGTVKTSSSSIAIFAVEGGASFRLREGDERDGWQLAQVGRREAVLQLGERTLTVKFTPGGAAASAPAPNGTEPSTPNVPLDGVDPNSQIDPNVPLDPNGMPIDPNSGLFDQNGTPIPMDDALKPRRDGVRKVGERPRPPATGQTRPNPARQSGETGEFNGEPQNDPSLRDGGDGGTVDDGGLIEGEPSPEGTDATNQEGPNQ